MAISISNQHHPTLTPAQTKISLIQKLILMATHALPMALLIWELMNLTPTAHIRLIPIRIGWLNLMNFLHTTMHGKMLKTGQLNQRLFLRNILHDVDFYWKKGGAIKMLGWTSLCVGCLIIRWLKFDSLVVWTVIRLITWWTMIRLLFVFWMKYDFGNCL